MLQLSQKRKFWRQFEAKLILIIVGVAVLLALTFNWLIYHQYYTLTISGLQEDAVVVYNYVEQAIDDESFTQLSTRADETKQIYLDTYQTLDQIRRIANIRYLYTAKQADDGVLIYVSDGLDPTSDDFRHVGDPIEHELIEPLSRCLQGEVVLGDDIMSTDWGVVFVAYFPVHDANGAVIGAVGAEFECENMMAAYLRVRMLTIAITLLLVLAFSLAAVFLLRRVVRSTESELNAKDELLITAREQALEGSRAKGAFLSRMSHEIRTPMNAIIGMTTIASKSDDIGKMRYCLEKIDSTSKQLLDIINDILDMSKIEAGKFDISSYAFNFDKMMQRVINVVQVKADEKHHRLTYDSTEVFDRMLISDELRLSQVLINLLGNAIKFTPDNGSITLSVRHTRLSDAQSRLTFSVRDTGIGMSEEGMARLFKTFEQADGGITRRFGGTGLGLVISRTIVNLLGGEITVESEEGKGSCFSFDVLVRWGDPLVDQAYDYVRNHFDLKILVVDDAQEVLDYFSEILGSYNIHCECALSGADAIEMVAESIRDSAPFSLVFMDWCMPGMNGSETARRIRELAGGDIIVVMFSSYDWAEIEKDVEGSGVSCFLPKPILPSVMFDTIMTLTDHSTLHKVESGSAAPDWRGKRILIVEDVEINREIMLSLLEETQVTIDCAEDGLVALERFQDEAVRYDAILMDVQMPRLDGLGATRAIRALGTPYARSVPIIAMTANAFKEDVDSCIEAGMNRHVAKPIDLEELIRVLVNAWSPHKTLGK